MKTSTLLLAAGAVGALVMLAKARKDGLGDSDMLLPPSGRTVTASGQVLGGLGLVTTYQDVYDAAPSQYNRSPRNDFVPGVGAMAVNNANLRAGQTKVEGDTCYIVRYGPDKRGSDRYGRSIKVKGDLGWEYDAAATAALRAKNDEARRLEAQTLAQKSVNETLMAIQKQAEAEMAAQQKAEQDRVLAQQKAEQERQAAVALAQQKAEQERQAVITKQPVPTPSTYNQSKQAYDAMAAAREQASMSQASSDTGYGRTSDDSGYGATQQVTEEGAPKLPERVASVQTPAAVMQTETAPPAPAAASGDSKVGLLVGGGVLAAIAAALAV